MAVNVDALAAEAVLRRLANARLLRQIKVAQPAVGAEWVQVVPGGVWWEVLAVAFLYTASAVAGNRVCSFQHQTQEGVRVAGFTNGAVQAATFSADYTYAAGIGSTISGNTILAPLPSPPLIVPGGDRLTSLTALRDVGDQYSNIVLTVVELAPDRITQVIRQLEQDVAGLLGDLATDDYQI